MQRLSRAGLNLPFVTDESFNLTDPDGNALSVTQYGPELYT